MYKSFLKPPGLFTFLLALFALLLAALLWLFWGESPSKTMQQTHQQTPTPSNTAPVMPEPSITEPGKTAPTAPPVSNTPTPPAPLNLQAPALSAPLGSLPAPANTAPEGPQQPPPAPVLPSAPNPLLPQSTPPSNQELIYGYEGKEDDSHKVTIGVQRDDITVKTQIKADETQQQVQGVEIEIKLPK